MSTKSNVRVAVIEPSTVPVKPVAPVPSVSSDAGASGSHGWTPEAECAVTVAATSVWISSTTPVPVVAGGASTENPQDRIQMPRVAGVASCSIVLIDVPVVTFAVAAVVAIAALYAL